jgi:hypothetical protein
VLLLLLAYNLVRFVMSGSAPRAAGVELATY